MINLEPLKNDIMKLERYYGDLKHYLDNFGEYVRLGKNNMTYEQAHAEINLVAKRHKDFVEAYQLGLKENEILALTNAGYSTVGGGGITRAPLNQNTTTISTLGGLDVNIPMVTLNQKGAATAYNETEKGLMIPIDGKKPVDTTLATNEFAKIESLIGELQSIETNTNNKGGSSVRPIKKYYLAEKSITVSLTANGEEYITGLSGDANFIVKKEDRILKISPLITYKGTNNIIVISKMKNQFVADGNNNDLSKIVGIPLSDALFEEIVSINDPAFQIYHNVKDMMNELASEITNKTQALTCITDIRAILASKNFKTTHLNYFKNYFKDMKIMPLSDEDKVGDLDYIYELDLNSSHVYVDSTEFNTATLLELEKGYYTYDMFMTEESFSNLYNIIRNECTNNGILELKSGIKFRYFILRESIKLKRLR